MWNVVPCPRSGVNRDFSVQPLDVGVNQGKPHAGSFSDLFGGEIGFEDAVPDIRRNAGSGV